MENAKTTIKKGKTIKKVFCYFGLVILNILLFAPMVTRIVFKEKKPEVKPDVVTVLTCEKTGESIRSTFLNDEPKNIQYQISGDYSMSSKEDLETVITNPVLKKFINYAQPEYDEGQRVSIIKFNTSITQGSLDYEIIFNNITNQEEYYRSQNFSCNRITQTQ